MALDIQVRTQEQLKEKGITWKPETIRPTYPKTRDFQPPNIQERRDQIESEFYPQFIQAERPMLCKYSPGIGKTVSFGLAAANLDRPHAFLFNTHRKVRDFLTDDNIDEDAYFHLKGMNQPVHTCCMDAGNEPCEQHGDEKELMCPVYERDSDDDIRERFEILAALVDHEYAHLMTPGIGWECQWSHQFDRVDENRWIVGVHEYQERFEDERDIIIDETPRFKRDIAVWTTADLQKAADLLNGLSDPLANPIADWIETELKNGIDSGNLSACAQPKVEIENDTAETLTELKVAYNEALDSQVRDNWNGTQPCFDAILAAIAETGFAPTACKEAIAGPATLHYCPRCGVVTAGGRCESEDCDWERDSNSILRPPGRRSRHRTSSFAFDAATRSTSVDYRLKFMSMTGYDEMPKDILVLDATGEVEKLAAAYGVSEDEIIVTGDEPIEMNARVTQISNGQYHAGIIKKAAQEDRRLARRIQRSIDMAGRKHSKPLFVIKQSLEYHFDFPDNGVVENWGALRGLNSMMDCDAVMCIGALHPRIDDLRREAELLAETHPDIEVGGEERSSWEESPYPPIQRDIIRPPGKSHGWTVQTKAFTGLTGTLFREVRENEFVQAVHRPRPILSDDPVHIYLLSNVPTELPIDEFVSWEEFIDPPVPENAIDTLVKPLVERYPEEEIEITTSELYELVGDDCTDRTVRNWMDELAEASIVDHIGNTPNNSKIYSMNTDELRSLI
ncbi:hypothetical protein M0R89_04420 [Halorussus limi]|uniref:Uncharacterized protein n=1 Tax=Halorussus limi TaxID=2938695 RepID=A0A8U0HXN1_9EURY|nr:hypothetical protein [Halorussus limi]UPV75314.1 hypothetical protein M0R89_04420 [Halorussus limi]